MLGKLAWDSLGEKLSLFNAIRTNIKLHRFLMLLIKLETRMISIFWLLILFRY